MMLKVFNLIMYFFFYSAAGWLGESIYCSYPARKWINRGFLFGPICPIYGTGAVVFLTALVPLKEYFIGKGLGRAAVLGLVFFIGLLLADIVEYFTSVIMEKMFHARWWDYTDEPFNLNGRICLKHTLYWGLAAVLFLEVVHPLVSGIFDHFPETFSYIFVPCALLVLIADVINAVKNAADVKKLIDKFQQFSDSVKENLDGLQTTLSKQKGKVSAWYSEMSAQLGELKKSVSLPSIHEKTGKEKRTAQNRIMRGYPHLRGSVQEKMVSLEKLMHDIKTSITDDEEMY